MSDSLCLNNTCSRGLVHYCAGGAPRYLSSLSGFEEKGHCYLEVKRGVYLFTIPRLLQSTCCLAFIIFDDSSSGVW